MRKESFTTITVKSPGFDEAYIRYLEAELKHHKIFMWWAFAGWIITAIWSYYK